MKKVFVLRKSDEYWQEGPPDWPCWSSLGAKYTKSWKTRRGVENFLRRNPRIAEVSKIEEVPESSPCSAWRGVHS